jgi:hypothetical protein
MEATSDLRKTAIPFEQVGRLIARQPTFAIYDAVGVPSIPEKMGALGTARALSLFLGTHYESYTAVAPYLACLDHELLSWTKSELWSRPWGVFVFSRAPFHELFHHFQHFLTARMPDGQSTFFRFQDPRILAPFLQSTESKSFGFWNSVRAFGWGENESVAIVTLSEEIARTQPNQQPSGVAFSTELICSLGKVQMGNFLDRCGKYLDASGTPLPPDRDAFFHSILRYASSVGIRLEIDLLRFMQLILGWKEMRSIAFVREILNYPGVAGSEKVDLLCEMAAFSAAGTAMPQSAGLDVEANAKAIKRFLGEHLNDRQFLQAHPDGALTMAPADTRWRKEWLTIYNEELACRAKVTRVPVGAASM